MAEKPRRDTERKLQASQNRPMRNMRGVLRAVKIGRNRLEFATRARMECLESATISPTANALHASVNRVQRCMIFVRRCMIFVQRGRSAGDIIGRAGGNASGNAGENAGEIPAEI
jgi:hypothetical protein